MSLLQADAEAIGRTVDILRRGGVVVFPTETYYGLGAHAFCEDALARVYALKGRPQHFPLLCLIDGRDRLKALVATVPSWAAELMMRFWPGPLTFVLPPRQGIPSALIGPGGGVAVRWSPHPLAQALVKALAAPIVGTSANLSGAPPVVRIQDLARTIVQGVGAVLDGGTLPGEYPSTVLDCTGWPPRIIRDGAVSREVLRRALPSAGIDSDE
jgi:L-threonylcarbamoyladenylate synthase